MIKALPKASLKSRQPNAKSWAWNQNPCSTAGEELVKTRQLSPTMLPLSQATWGPGFPMTGALYGFLIEFSLINNSV